MPETAIVFGTTIYRVGNAWSGEQFYMEHYMGRPKGALNKPKIEMDSGVVPPVPIVKTRVTSQRITSPADQLIEALNFVTLAGTKNDAPYKEHVVLNNNFAICYDGQLTAGYPIVETLECCPHLSLLKSAITKCGAKLAISETESGALSILSNRLRATVPCLPFSEMPDFKFMSPDVNVHGIDDRIKEAFRVCGSVVSESATSRAFEAAVLLEANQCTATDGKVLMQYWHGVDLPPDLFLPKIFTAAVCKTKSPLVGFGYKKDVSVTFFFEDGSWIKTQVYNDKFPSESVAKILNVNCVPIDVPENLFDAIATVAEFADGDEHAMLSDGRVSSHYDTSLGADYEMPGLVGEICMASKYAKIVAPFTKQIDITTIENKMFIFGDNMRGVVVGIVNPSPPDSKPPTAE